MLACFAQAARADEAKVPVLTQRVTDLTHTLDPGTVTRLTATLAALGLFGAALFFGDSMITPAISVLSAVEGLKVIDPQLADFVVPVTAVIIVALFSVQRRQPLSARQRIIMYRFIEFIGRWSMLDIFVIAILVAVVNFGRIASVEANLGAVAFASVVILTMLAAVTFDPRLIWDNTESDDDHE